MANAVTVVVMIVLLGAVFYLWRFFMQKAMRVVVSVFRERGALDEKRAMKLEALGLAQAPILRRVFRPRDYRQQAMRMLGREGVIRMAEGERFYLSEDALAQSRLKKFANIS